MSIWRVYKLYTRRILIIKCQFDNKMSIWRVYKLYTRRILIIKCQFEECTNFILDVYW